MDQLPSTPPNRLQSVSPNVRAQRAKDLTRSQRIRRRTLRFDAGWKLSPIAKTLHFTKHQVQLACFSQATPTKRPGRPLTLSSSQVDETIAFISQTRRTRRIVHLELATGPFASWNISEGIITHALALRGYGRHIALGKPGLSEAAKRKRLAFAMEHLDWTIE